jgi:hypothetical protein
MPYVNTASDYTPSASWHRGNRIWIAHGNRELHSAPFAGLGGDDTLTKASRLTKRDRLEMTNLIKQQLMLLAPAQRAKVLADAGINTGVNGLGQFTSLALDAGSAVSSASSVAAATSGAAAAVESSIFTAANIAGAINGLTQLGIGVTNLRLNQIDQQRKADASDVQSGAALAVAAAKQQEAEEMKKQTALLAAGKGGGGGGIASIAKNKGVLIGGGIGVLVLGAAAFFLLRRRGKK